jgi:hypothetical protein
MKKAIVVIALVFAVVALMGCPSVNLPVAAAGATVGAKTGQSSGQLILGIIGDVDAGMLAAAKNGGITKIATVDVQQKLNFGGIFIIYTTTVTGE